MNDDSTIKSTDAAPNTPTAPPTNALAWFVGKFHDTDRQSIAQVCYGGTPGNYPSYLYKWDKDTQQMTVHSGGLLGTGNPGPVWLAANLNGPSKTYIVNITGVSGENLDVATFYWNGSYFADGWAGPITIDGGYITWLVGDLDGSGVDQLIQIWQNGSNLGIRTYGILAGTVPVVLLNNFDQMTTPCNDGRDQFLLADVDGDGNPEIVQVHSDHGGYLTGFYAFKIVGNSIEMLIDNAPPSKTEYIWAEGYIAGDINGDGIDEVVQGWGTNSNLGLIAYSIPSGTTTATVIADNATNIALGNNHAMMMSELLGKPPAQVVQLNADSNLDICTYSYQPGQQPADEGTMVATNYPDFGSNWSGSEFVIGNVFSASGPPEIFQMGNNNNVLGMAAYGYTSDGFKVRWTGNPQFGT